MVVYDRACSTWEEKEEQSKEMNEIKHHLVNERTANQQLVKDLNKTPQKLSKLQPRSIRRGR